MDIGSLNVIRQTFVTSLLHGEHSLGSVLFPFYLSKKLNLYFYLNQNFPTTFLSSIWLKKKKKEMYTFVTPESS